eukprot:m.309247 g.309247  ORF g.309247 m.309247 type:complete len:493 (+) comp45889_c0_seq1:206-1684(+)
MDKIVFGGLPIPFTTPPSSHFADDSINSSLLVELLVPALVLALVLIIVGKFVYERKKSGSWKVAARRFNFFTTNWSERRQLGNEEAGLEDGSDFTDVSPLLKTGPEGPELIEMTVVDDFDAYLGLSKPAREENCRLATMIYSCGGEHGRKGDFVLEFDYLFDLKKDEVERRFRLMHRDSEADEWEDQTLSSAISLSEDGDKIVVRRKSLCEMCVLEVFGEKGRCFSVDLIAFATIEMVGNLADVTVHVATDPMNDEERLQYWKKLTSSPDVHGRTKYDGIIRMAAENELFFVECTAPEHLSNSVKLQSNPGKEKFPKRQMRNVCKALRSGSGIYRYPMVFTVELTQPPSAEVPLVIDVTFSTACKDDEAVLGKVCCNYVPSTPISPFQGNCSSRSPTPYQASQASPQPSTCPGEGEDTRRHFFADSNSPLPTGVPQHLQLQSRAVQHHDEHQLPTPPSMPDFPHGHNVVTTEVVSSPPDGAGALCPFPNNHS